MKILVIIPAYNESKNIVKTVNKLREANKNIDYIVVNDGSTDQTISVLKNNKMNYLDLPINLGIGGAMQTGYLYAFKNNYDIAIQFDGDGQHNPNYISKMVDELNNGYDMVIGSRYIEELSKFKSTKMRRLGIRFLSKLIKLVSGKKIYDPTSGYRCVNKKIIELFANDYPIDYPEPDSVTKIIRLGYKVKEIPVEMEERENGKSSIGFFDSIYYMIKVSICIIITAIRFKKGDD